MTVNVEVHKIPHFKAHVNNKVQTKGYVVVALLLCTTARARYAIYYIIGALVKQELWAML